MKETCMFCYFLFAVLKYRRTRQYKKVRYNGKRFLVSHREKCMVFAHRRNYDGKNRLFRCCCRQPTGQQHRTADGIYNSTFLQTKEIENCLIHLCSSAHTAECNKDKRLSKRNSPWTNTFFYLNWNLQTIYRFLSLSMRFMYWHWALLYQMFNWAYERGTKWKFAVATVKPRIGRWKKCIKVSRKSGEGENCSECCWRNRSINY